MKKKIGRMKGDPSYQERKTNVKNQEAATETVKPLNKNIQRQKAKAKTGEGDVLVTQ